MAITSFPFQSITNDRQYSDLDFANYFAQFFKNGVAVGVGTGLQVKPSTPVGMTVLVGTGGALVNGRQLTNNSDYSITLTAASTTAARVDSVVVQLNLPLRQVSLVYKEGVTTVQRDANIYELQLATITVPQNASTINAGNITDKRSDTTVCGYSTPFTEVNLQSLQDQYQAMLDEAFTTVQTSMNADATTLDTLLTDQQTLFDTWFAGLQDTLTTNVESNLQAQIDLLDADTSLTTITHNLNEYPHVRALSWTHGVGLTGLGDEPLGLFGGSNVKTVPCSVEYLNKQSLKVNVSVGKTMVTPTVTKLNTREWLLTEGTNSMQITLMEV